MKKILFFSFAFLLVGFSFSYAQERKPDPSFKGFLKETFSNPFQITFTATDPDCELAKKKALNKCSFILQRNLTKAKFKKNNGCEEGTSLKWTNCYLSSGECTPVVVDRKENVREMAESYYLWECVKEKE